MNQSNSRQAWLVLIAMAVVVILSSCGSETKEEYDWAFLPPLENQIYRGNDRFAILEAITSFDGLRNNYQLVFRCDRSGLKAFVNWFQYLGYQQTYTVGTKLPSDDAGGISTESGIWKTGIVDPYYTFYPDSAIELSSRLTSVDWVTFVLEVNSEFDRMAIFRLPNSTKKLPEFVRICSEAYLNG